MYTGLTRETLLEIMRHYSTLKRYLRDRGHRILYEVTDGTSKVGSVTAQYDDIVSVYGEPFSQLSDGKCDVQWIIETSHGVATIYNYKDGVAYLGDEGKDIREITQWSIGAKNKLAGKEVKEQIYNYIKEQFGD